MEITWKAQLRELQALRGNFKTHEAIMTTYERQTIKAEIDRKAESVAGMILTGALTEYNGAITGYQQAAQKLDQAKASELRRWDSGKLTAERQNLRQMIDLAIEGGVSPLGGRTTAEKVTRILDEARQSGDAIRIRAAAEVGRAIAPKAPIIVPLVGDLEALTIASRRTVEIAGVESERQAALDKLITLRDGLPDIGAAIGESTGEIFDPGSLAKAIRKVRLNQDGSAEILEDSDPDVCGFAILPDKTTTAGG